MSEIPRFYYVIPILGVAVVLALLFMPTQADDVYFLNNGAGGGGETTECINLASQYQIVLNSTDGNCFIRALANGTGITLAVNSTHVIINSTGGESTVCTGQTGNYNIVASSSGGNCSFKNLLAGTGITLSSNSTHITITNSAPDNTTCANVGTGKEVYKDGECNFRTLVDGNGITYTQNTNDITTTSYCDSTGSGEAVCESGNDINSLIGSGGISIVDTTGDLTISPRWELLCENELQASNTALSCADFPIRENIVFSFAVFVITSNTDVGIQFNGDTSTNYSWRKSTNGGADTTGTSDTDCFIIPLGVNANGKVNFAFVDNTFQSGRKVMYANSADAGSTGATNAPARVEFACKWDNTTDFIDTITIMRSGGTGSFDTGSHITVWGYD